MKYRRKRKSYHKRRGSRRRKYFALWSIPWRNQTVICTSPFRLKNKEGTVISLPCGHCTGCRIQRAREWASRLIHEMSYHEKIHLLR